MTIAIACDSLDRLRHLSLQLLRLGQTVRVFTAGNNIEDRPRVCLCTFYGLGWRHTSQYDLILVLDAPKHSVSERNSRSATLREPDSLGFSLRRVI